MQRNRHFNTYSGWKRAVKKLAKDSNLEPLWTGDKDIDGCYLDEVAECEWDGHSGVIEPIGD